MIHSYPRLRRWLHWTIAVLVIAMLPMGMIFTDFDNRGAIEGIFGEGSFNVFYDLHKSTGFLILFLMLVRIVAAIRLPKPPYAVPLTGLERAGSGAVHGLIYVMLLAMPLLGWLGVSAYDAPLPVFGLFEMPALIGRDRDLSEDFFEWHEIGAKIVIALVVVHIGAALYHQLVKKDGLIRRMWPSRG
ncbi:cytochrome b [Roseobacter sp. HKCCA0434]|uniref:cytochrome b n=1 Tax=Roseobacter sp. HKCCA0434 TaxID=3079297 RepID=UPI0029058BCA|nr:cytochrome b [Roseobacter sp. HKCCA0434]